MTVVYPLLHMITRLSALYPVFTPFEACAHNLIQRYRPSSVSFVCKSSQHCPDNIFHKLLQVPSRTLFGLETTALPFFQSSEIVFLLDDNLVTFNNETVQKYRLDGKTDFKMVVVANMSYDVEDDLKTMKDLFAAMWRSGIAECAVLLLNDTASQMYTYLPYKNSSSCEDTSPVLLGECTKVAEQVFDVTYKVFNFNQCPLRIALVDDRPFFDYPMHGRLSPLIKEIALRMNARIESMMPTTGKRGGTCGPEEFTGSRRLVWDGKAHMTVGLFNQKECSALNYISLAYTQCLSWCTPVLSASDYVYLFVLKQLQPNVWVALMTSVLIVSITVSLLCPATHEHWTSNDAFNLALRIYAQPPPIEPRTTPIRVIVVFWLWACLVLRTAYEGELKSQSAVQLGTRVLGLEELANVDLLLCSAIANLQILKNFESPLAQGMYNKMKVCNGSLYENLEAAAYKKDRAVFTSDLRCSVTASELRQGKVNLYSRTGGCFKMYQVSPIITFPGSPFQLRWRKLLDRCNQAGLILKWLDIQPPQKDLGTVRPYSVGHLLPALFVLSVGCLVGSLLFVGEKTFHKWFRSKPELKVHSCMLRYRYRTRLTTLKTAFLE